MTTLTDKMKTWQIWVGGVLVTLALLSALYGGASFVFMPRAEAGQEHQRTAEDRKSIIRKWIEEAEAGIQAKSDEITEIRYDRPDLSDRAKDELIAVRQRQIAKLEARLECLRRDRLDCL